MLETTGVSVATAGGPYGIALSPDGQHLYVGNDSNGVINRYARNAAGYPAGVLSYADGLSGGDDLAGVRLSVVSADGRFVYAAAVSDDAINVFERNLETGALTYQDSIKFDSAYTLCLTPGCTVKRIQGLDGAYEPLLSPDGKFLYVSGISSDAITVFRRDPGTGGLRGLLNLPAVRQEIIDSTNLNGAYGMAMSADGKYVYATGYSSSSLVAFSRNPSTGELTAVNGGVYKAPAIAGLNGVFRVTISPDGNFLYTASFDGNSVTAFKRNPATGLLTLVDTYSHSQDGISDLESVSSVAISPDGNYLFATAFNSNAVSIFARDKQTGELAQVQTIKRNAGGQPPLGNARDVKVSPDGRMIFVTGRSDNQITAFGLANPVPQLTSLAPASAAAGSPELILTVNGNNFVEGAAVTWNGQNVPTTFVNAGEVQATVAANRLQTAGSAEIGVTNPPPLGGPASNTLSFTITSPNENPVPSLEQIAPGGTVAGDPGLTITIYGAGFIPATKALWNGVERATSYISPSALEMQVSTADLAQPGTAVITVQNPAPGGGLSNNLSFEIAGPGENPTPVIQTIAPGFVTVGATTGEVIVVLNGAGFMPESQARWNGANRPTSYIDGQTLEVVLGAADLLAAGNGGIDVINRRRAAANQMSPHL
ncbi:MAG: lactonase family protein [Oscillochloris sp.]|nr:lactonase family protein [Oscillochloris sp.]